MKTLLVGPDGTENPVLKLLHAFGVQGGHTLTLYTSRRGRIWFTIKTWGKEIYASSAEVDAFGGEEAVIGALATCCMMHWAKLEGRVARQDTWLSMAQVAEVESEVTDKVTDWIYGTHEKDPIADDQEPPDTSGAIEGKGKTK